MQVEVQPIPARTWSELKDESDTQIRSIFQDEDLSSLANNQRRQRSRGYASIEELFDQEFDGLPSTQEASMEGEETVTSPSVFSSEKPIHGTSNDKAMEYKMVLKEIDPGQKEPRSRNKFNTLQKNRFTRRVKKSISQYEFSRRLLQQSLSSQVKSLGIDSEFHSIFSIGKHLYSSNFNGKLKVCLGGATSPVGALPTFRPLKKLQEWSKCQQAEMMVSQSYHLMTQKSCSEVRCSESSNVDSPVNYLTFFEEGYIINLMVVQSSLASWVKEFQIYSVNPKADQVVQGLVSSLTNLKSTVGGEVRVCDLIGYLKTKVKEFSQNCPSDILNRTNGSILRSP